MLFPKNKKRGRPLLTRRDIDKGTPELQRKRGQLIGKDKKEDACLAESLLGVLNAQGLISRPLYEAGCCFEKVGRRYFSCLGHSFHYKTCSFSIKCHVRWRAPDSSCTEKKEIQRAQVWRNALTALLKAGLPAYSAVLRVIFFSHDLYACPPGEVARQEVRILTKGLEELHAYFTKARQDTPSKLACLVQDSQKATRFLPALTGCQPGSPQLHPC